MLCMADDWGWPHAGAYGDGAVSTPAFDRIAAEGVLLRHAYTTSPSCTAARPTSIPSGRLQCSHWAGGRARPRVDWLFDAQMVLRD